MAEKIETTHTLLDRELIVYRRERSNIWQCRFKVDGIWQRASTKERDLKKAKTKANELRIEAEICKRSNLPVITRKFRGVGVRVLLALAGHSNMATTQRYIDLRPAMLKAAVELV